MRGYPQFPFWIPITLDKIDFSRIVINLGKKKSLFLVGTVLGRPAPFAKSHIIGRENKRTNNKTMRLDTKNHGAAGYHGPVKIELRTAAGTLEFIRPSEMCRTHAQ